MARYPIGLLSPVISYYFYLRLSLKTESDLCLVLDVKIVSVVHTKHALSGALHLCTLTQQIMTNFRRLRHI
jgi:hypothetical protein